MTPYGMGSGYEPIPYHELTKHTPESVRSSTHRIDWMDRPEPFKIYPGLGPIPLPERAADTGYPAVRAVSGQLGRKRDLDLPELARLVVMSAGVRRVWQQPNGKPLHLRNYACAGALYPIEVYLACGAIEGLEPGLYHYSPLDDSLRLIRPGDPRPCLLRATGYRESVGRAPVTVVLTGIPWRTCWKYQARGYRHLFWDSGMILANLLALSGSGGHPAEVVLGFVDDELDALVGIDGRNEMSICMVPIGYADPSLAPVDPAEEPAPPIRHEVGRISFRQREFNEILEAQLRTTIRTPSEARLWQQDPFPSAAPLPADVSFDGIEKVIRRRGSKRQFTHEPITKEEFEGILAHSTYDLACDWGLGLSQVGFIANAVEELEPGAYAAVWTLDQIALGNLRAKARFLCLDQDLGGDAAATIFLMTDLQNAALTLGPRSYRAAQLNAGIVAGRMYLCAYACRLGATGLTFYDDEVRKLFQTEAEPMLDVAIGH